MNLNSPIITTYPIIAPYEKTTHAWRRLLQHLVQNGRRVSARGLTFNEMLNVSLTVDMVWPMVTSDIRNASLKYYFGEAWWILSGKGDLESILPYNKNMARYADNGQFFGAYGPPFQEQIDRVADELIRDPNSRRAVLTLWRPNPPMDTKDFPCTISIQWVVRGGHLHCFDSMRSSDAWLGWPYDIFTFSCASAYLSLLIKMKTGFFYPLGNITLNAISQHLYSTDIEKAIAVLKAEKEGTDRSYRVSLDPSRFENTSEFLTRLKELADQFGTSMEGLRDPCVPTLTI